MGRRLQAFLRKFDSTTERLEGLRRQTSTRRTQLFSKYYKCPECRGPLVTVGRCYQPAIQTETGEQVPPVLVINIACHAQCSGSVYGSVVLQANPSEH